MKEKISNSQMRDTSSKLIFSDPILCAQFLRGYVDILSVIMMVDRLRNAADYGTNR